MFSIFLTKYEILQGINVRGKPRKKTSDSDEEGVDDKESEDEGEDDEVEDPDQRKFVALIKSSRQAEKLDLA